MKHERGKTEYPDYREMIYKCQDLMAEGYKLVRRQGSNPKRAKVWCPSCDTVMVSLGTKCKECGTRINK